MNYIKREKCVITGSELEDLSSSKQPIFCGCVEEDLADDIMAQQDFVISKAGVIQLKNLIPLDILYRQGHGSGSVGKIWQEHHEAFAKFLMDENPSKILEIGGGHGKLALECMKLSDTKLNYTIVEPNTPSKHENIKYIDKFFDESCLNGEDVITHSHTFEHIYNPHEFLELISNAMINDSKNTGGGGETSQNDIFLAKYAKMA